MSESGSSILKKIVEELRKEYLVTLVQDDQETAVCLLIELEDKRLIPCEIQVNSQGLVELRSVIEWLVTAFQCVQGDPVNEQE